MKISSDNPYAAIFANEARESGSKNQTEKPGGSVDGRPALKKTIHAETTELYNAEGRVFQKSDADLQKDNRQAVNQETVMKEIWEQTYALLQEYSKNMGTLGAFEKGMQEAALNSGNEKDPLGLGEYFASNPEALEEVENGQIPDYFNVQNTGDRILDIWLSDFDGETDVSEFIELVKNYVNRAYGEVSEMFNGLPQLVQDTQQYVMQQLDRFASEQAMMM